LSAKDNKRNFPIFRENFTRNGTITIILVFGYGIIGFMVIMGLDFVNSIYFTMITIATVGYGDIAPVTPLQKIFVVTLALLGIGLIAYIFSTIIENVSIKINEVRSGSKMKRKLENMKNHYILCGYGRVGSVVLKELIKRNQKVIIVDNDKETIERLNDSEIIESNEDIITLLGDATDPDIMRKFRAEYSNGLILTTGSDVNNLFIVLSLRDDAPNTWIVSRASKQENIQRLYNAGANKVISPEFTGGLELFLAAVQPNLVRITDTLNPDDIKKEIEIILHHGCTIESIEYHFQGIKRPFTRDVGFKTMKDVEEYWAENQTKNAISSLKQIHSIQGGIKSHLISGPNQEALDAVIKELKENNLLIGVNMTDEEILTYNNQRLHEISSNNKL
jgi:voltage-gated potassium channel